MTETDPRRIALSKRVRVARDNKRKRDRIANRLDAFLTWGAERLWMCGEGKKNNWSVLFSVMWFTDCPCCLFYRGVTFGLALALMLLAPVFVFLLL